MVPQSTEIRIEVTTKCNYNCVICPREKLTRKRETMSFDLFKRLFDKINEEVAQYNTLTFPGMGEPLLDEGLEDKIAYAKSRGFTVLMLSNGSLLSIERFKKLESAGLDSIRISMYGDTPESYLAVHGIKDVNLFHAVKKNLTAIAAIKKHTSLLLTYNIVKDVNETALDSWIQYWKDKVDLIEVWRPHNWGTAKHYREVQQQKLKTCGRPWKTPLQVQVDGTINMCCFDFNGELLLGDMRTQTLSEIFESPAFNRIAMCHTTGDFSGSGLICEDCDQRNADKTDVMLFNSKFNVQERVHQVSTTYKDIL